MSHYTITLTGPGGLTVDHIGVAKQWFNENCVNCYVVNEFGDSELFSHLQVVAEFNTKKTSNVSGKMKKLYALMDIEVLPRITYRVKALSEMVGAIWYASKEINGKGNVVLLKGWRQSWIDEQVKAGEKKRPVKEYEKLGIRLTNNTAPGAMFKWAQAHNMQITNKAEFIAVGKQMTCDGYQLGGCRVKGLFMDVCGLFKNGDALEAIWTNDLFFIQDRPDTGL